MSKVVFFLLFVILVAGCKTKPADIEPEKLILYELLPAIVDVACIDVRKYGNMPPVLRDKRIRFEEDGYPVIPDGSSLSQEDFNKLSLWQEKMDHINKDTSKLLIGFNPAIRPIKENIAFARQMLSDTALANTDTATLVLDLNEDLIQDHFRVTSDVKGAIHNRLSLSRILFNKSQTMGIIDVGFNCNGNCGKGYFVLIKKGSNGKWFISRVKQTWIA